MSCGYCGGSTAQGMTLAELVERDFRRARWRQRFGRLVARLGINTSQSQLVCFARARSQKAGVSRRLPVLRSVELDKVEGSVGRCWDFDQAFMPVCSCGNKRWKRVDEAFRKGKQLPPVKLYKLGERYFVEDGNHRVSVARYRNLPMIEAMVTEFLDGESAVTGPEKDSEGDR